MSEAGSGFFERLELELRDAAERPVRRVPRPGPVLAVVTGLVVLAVALVPALVVLGGDSERAGDLRDGGPGSAPAPVGSVVQRADGPHVVVATGTTRVAGAWQMETYTSDRLADPETGEEYQPAGLPCLGLVVLAEGGLGGQCGEFPRTPGFSPLQESVPNLGPAREILVYGRAPERASAVRVTARGEAPIEADRFEGPAGTRGDFYLVAVPPDLEDARVNWYDGAGRPGSRGHSLLPP